MSFTDGPLYCTQDDVKDAMQEADAAFLDGPLDSNKVDAARGGASDWVQTRTNAHFYDSGSNISGTVSTSTASAADIRLNVPSSPHRQGGQLLRHSDTLATRQYPNTQAGPFVRLKLPYRDVSAIEVLEVRDPGGGVTDWVASSDILQGRDEDYYFIVDGTDEYGRTYLYLRAATIGGRVDFDDLVTVELTYGQDWDAEPWPDVRRGVAHLAAAELASDDDVLTRIPDSGAVVNVETAAQVHLDRAMSYLSDYERVAAV